MTIDVTLNTLNNLSNQNTAISVINNNSAVIEGGFTTALNVTGDQMQGTLDMNTNQILNLPSPGTANSPARLVDLMNASVSGTVVFPIVTGGTNITATGTGTITVSTNTSVVFTAVSSSTISTGNISVSGSGVFGSVNFLNATMSSTSGVVNVQGQINVNQVNANSITTGGLYATAFLNNGNMTTAGTGVFATIYTNNITGNTTVNASTVNATTANATTVNATNVIVTNLSSVNLVISGGVKIPSSVSSSLPSATGNTGYRFICSNATATTFGATLTGGGTVIAPVYSNGTNWIIG